MNLLDIVELVDVHRGVRLALAGDRATRRASALLRFNARSMHEEDGPVVALEEPVGAAPEDDLATTRATIGAHHH